MLSILSSSGIARSAASRGPERNRARRRRAHQPGALEHLEGRALLSVGYGWTVAAGSMQVYSAAAVATDPAGNVYVTGGFKGTVDFEPQDPADPADTLTSHTPPGRNEFYADAFVAKYAPAGNLLWVRGFGPGGRADGGADIVVDLDGNILITGGFQNTADFGLRPDGTPVTLQAQGQGQTDVFLAKLDPSGATLWAVAMGGPDEDAPSNVAVDPAGNVYTTGTFSGAATFGATTLQSTASTDTFLTKHASDGTFIFAEHFDDMYVPNGLAVSGQGIYMTGDFSGTMDADPGPGQRLLTSGYRYSSSMFLVKLDLDGGHLWSFTLGGSRLSGSAGWDVAVDDAGNVYATGIFSDTIDFDPSAGKASLTAQAGGGYVAKYSASGSFQWARALLGTGNIRPTAIALEAGSHLWIGGWYDGSADFDPGKAKATRTSNGSADAFVLELDLRGNYVAVATMGGAGWDGVFGVALGGSGNVYVAGSFTSITADFDPTSDVDTKSNAGV